MQQPPRARNAQPPPPGATQGYAAPSRPNTTQHPGQQVLSVSRFSGAPLSTPTHPYNEILWGAVTLKSKPSVSTGCPWADPAYPSSCLCDTKEVPEHRAPWRMHPRSKAHLGEPHGLSVVSTPHSLTALHCTLHPLQLVQGKGRGGARQHSRSVHSLRSHQRVPHREPESPKHDLLEARDPGQGLSGSTRRLDST